MGCCQSKTPVKRSDDDDYDHVRATRQPTARSAGGGHALGGTGDPVREPTTSEKRTRAAQAAEARQADWRQGGTTDAEQAKRLRQRREKDDLLGKIYNRYAALGKEPPIGLPSCDNDQLRRHLESLKN